MRKQTLICLGGLQFTGKTALGSYLQEHLGLPFLGVNCVQKAMFFPYGKPPRDTDQLELVGYQLSRAYPAMWNMVDILLGMGDSVIVEGSFSRQSHQDAIAKVAAAHPGATMKFVLLKLSPDKENETLAQRIASRPPDDPSGAVDATSYFRVKARYEPITVPHIEIDVSLPKTTEEVAREVMEYISA